MPPRSGQEYLTGLRQRPRDVWLAGERIDDVVEHPTLARCAQSLARLYDMQHRRC
jgi:aromatic ring hydroxylase